MIVLTCGLASAADIDGKWMVQVKGKRGEVTETLMLKANGNQLTGTIQGRRGAAPISEGMMNGTNVSFKVTRARKEKKVTQQYKGTLSGGELKLTMTGPKGGTRDLLFKRAK